MPSFYREGEYDLAGFTVGVVERGKLIDGSSIRVGDQLIGIGSSGLHSNGYSLARKILFEHLRLKAHSRTAGLSRTVGEELLVPTRIYVKPILNLLQNFPVHGIAHITGGGITDNLPRVIPKGCQARVRLGTWPVHPIFQVIQEAGKVSEEEMLRTFNNGIGMILAVPPRAAGAVVSYLKGQREKAYPIGEIVKAGKKEKAIRYE
jgi:phosphoribosylformylglycinamidine cyclo-ligase